MANPSPVSRKGRPNKFNAELKDMILGALEDAGGQDYLARQANENPGPFMALIGKVLPKEVKADIDTTIKLSPATDYLNALVERLNATDFSK